MNASLCPKRLYVIIRLEPDFGSCHVMLFWRRPVAEAGDCVVFRYFPSIFPFLPSIQLLCLRRSQGVSPWKKLFPADLWGFERCGSELGSTAGGGTSCWGQIGKCFQPFALIPGVDRGSDWVAPVACSLSPVSSLQCVPDGDFQTLGGRAF